MSMKELIRKYASLLIAGFIAAGAAASASAESAPASSAGTKSFVLQQIRNATIKIDYGDVRFLVDPMLAKKGSYPAAPGSFNSEIRNPTVDLPIPLEKVIDVDAVIVTHLHFDHWDNEAKERIPKDMPIFAQNDEDARTIRGSGFRDVRVLNEATEFKGVRLIKTSGQHGSDAAMAVRGKLLGTVSGVVFQRPGFKSLYVAGDTVWNTHVQDALATYRPDVIVLNAGYVRFNDIDGAIIMGKEDLYRVNQAAPGAYIVAVHLESLNHATQSRQELKDYIKEKSLDPQRVLVPDDGESYSF
ncbi:MULTISPECIES: MBL fold metallo-hydrolase [Pseudomonadota]|jgi:L-ascorbate metabolism protein UlaG (beta-lactamase superfamily)|uniref:MBL fold metallo-hydrolase n=3 Tax=Lysobacterales TaxID=135614 RepID=A0ABS8LI96_XANEU|nr:MULTISPECIES: MBL fold metallo-hydrolase [Pseudomonadota]ABM41582.1 putative secreted protein [Acidovorax sp. JS42]AOY65858.1 hypothetical protein BHE83_04275 [Xanthomonas euvesicatoria pv. vesicatoria str. 85-10]AQQ17766.1 hypothetical protein A8D61_04135 [Burkholderia cenocepacia]AQQ19622.1 hypothetical protein A8D61_14515 [Burkholderia cenocepacia]KLB39774.1 hypothetical protein XEUV206_16165 [Xanthomonas euvesicatoria]